MTKSSNINIILIDNSSFWFFRRTTRLAPLTEVAFLKVLQDIVIPDSYPFQPVKMKYITKVYDPNLPVLTLKSTFIFLRSLLCSPGQNDLQDAEVAKHYMTSRSCFEDTARYWTHASCCGGDSGLDNSHIHQFEAIGFKRNKVIDVARRLNYRGANIAKIPDDKVVEELLKA
ncbi:hypothetical protein EI94DRAFT_1805392 [Lactarius quietus]|nr:hypothetical protein EI94DRAFT_1805392 [Lactarius quietus]